MPPARVRASSRPGERLVLGPVREAARPELVVLVEALVLRGRQECTPPGEAPVEGDQLLVAIDVDLLRLALDLVFEVGEVLARFSRSTAVTIDAAK